MKRDATFRLTWDVRCKRRFTQLPNCTFTLRSIKYNAFDPLDEYLKMSVKTSQESSYNFCKGVISLYKEQYLCKPTLFGFDTLDWDILLNNQDVSDIHILIYWLTAMSSWCIILTIDKKQCTWWSSSTKNISFPSNNLWWWGSRLNIFFWTTKFY